MPDNARLNPPRRWRYTAVDLEGKLHKGVAEARDYDALYTRLRQGELFLQTAVQEGGEGRRRLLKAKELASFCQELSTLLDAGVNAVRALTIISQEEPLAKPLRDIYSALLSEVRKGSSLSSAAEAQGVFPDLMIGMLRAGEENGDLPGVTARLAAHYTQEHKTRQQAVSALMYPCFLAALALGAVIVIFTFVLPEFEDLFAGMESLPAFTVGLMALSDFLTQRWYVAIAGVAALAVLIRGLFAIPQVRLAWDRWKLKTRLLGLGRICSVICTARLARTISSLYSSGVPLVSALQTARDTVGNRYIAGQFDGVVARVRAGESLSASLGEVDGLRRKLRGTIQVGEETGRLGPMLDSAADNMEYDSRQATKRLLTILEPVLIVLMALAVGVIIIGVMLPIINSYGAIEGSANL